MNTAIIFFIGLVIGGLIIFIFINKQEINLLKSQNKILQKEKDERNFRINQNELNIKLLKDKDAEQDLQILACHEWLTKLTKIRNEVENNTNIVATRRFREANKLSEDDTYISK